MSIMLREKVVCVFCGHRENFLQSTKQSVALGNEEKRNTRSCG